MVPAALFFLFANAATQAQQTDPRTPALMAGKKTLYQRVLTRPGATLSDSPGEDGKIAPTFSRYYVYGEKDVANETWLEVGPDTKGQMTFWTRKEKTVPWHQQIALSIANPAGRSPLYFYKNKASIEGVYADFEPDKRFDEIEQNIAKNGSDPRIVAKEPSAAVNLADQFYLLPILSAEEIVTGTRHYVRLLEVASVAKGNAPAANNGQPSSNAAAKPLVLKSFKAAVVFVIDSTISMGPYIDRTKEAVRKVYETIEEEGLSDQVKFGLYAYRSSIDATPGLEYVSKEFVDPSTVKDGADFLEKVKDLKPATVSSAAFNEDAYAGVMSAMEKVKWADFGGRYVILVTDAGALGPENDLASIDLGGAQIAQELAHRGIALYTLHLKTAAGAKNHQSAQTQYESLSHNKIVDQSLYYDVDAGSVDAFGQVVDDLAEQVTDQVQSAFRGESVAGSAATADASFGNDEDEPAPEPNLPADQQRLKDATALLGHAMQLAYIGEKTGAKVPDIIRAWVSDRDAKDMKKSTTEVRVLLTKNQLSDLKDIVSTVLGSAQAGVIDPDLMFDQLRSAAVTMGRDPNNLSNDQSTKLVELGLFGEYFDGLPPYPTKVLTLTQEEWETMKGGQQDALIVELNRKLRLYEYMNSDTDRWVSLAKGADSGEDVYPVPLSALP